MKLRSAHSISLIVPIFNEEEVIEETLKIYHHKLSQLTKVFEIIVVDDGSNDQTPAIVKQLSKKFPKMRVIRHQSNFGIGRSILDGFRAASLDWVTFNSADQPFDLDDLRKIAESFNTADLLVAVRRGPTGHGVLRKVISKVNARMLRLLFSVSLDDFHFIFICKRSLVKSITLNSSDAFGQAELLIKIYQKAHKVIQFPAIFHPRQAGESKYDNPARHFKSLKDLLNFRIFTFKR